MDSKISRQDYVIIYQDTVTNCHHCLSCHIEIKLCIGIERIHGNCPCYCNSDNMFLCENKIYFDNIKHTVFATRDKCIEYNKTKCENCVINKRYNYNTKMNKE